MYDFILFDLDGTLTDPKVGITTCVQYALKGFGIEETDFIEVLKMFNAVSKDNVNDYNKKINEMFSNVDYGFLDTKTIYKVKKDEKKA